VQLVDGDASSAVVLAQRTSGGVDTPVLMFQASSVVEDAYEVGPVSPPEEDVLAVGIVTVLDSGKFSSGLTTGPFGFFSFLLLSKFSNFDREVDPFVG
jgi:hypothetical protein